MKKAMMSAVVLAGMLWAGVGFSQTAAPATSPTKNPAVTTQPKETHGQAVSGTAQSTPSGPGKGQTVSTEAKDNHGQKESAEKKHHGKGHGHGHHKGPKK